MRLCALLSRSSPDDISDISGSGINFSTTEFIIGLLLGTIGTLLIIAFGNNVTTIGKSAFHWCESLTTVTIPDGITLIGGGITEVNLY